MNNKRNRRQLPDIHINVAPLVEVMLVLIIIFMIATPMLSVGVPVDLPKTKASSLNESASQPIIVSIDKDSRIFVEEAQISLDDLILKLPMILENGKSDTVYVRGDKNLQYGKIMEIMGVISASGACKVSLISESGAASPTMTERPPKNRSINVGKRGH
jgi:biopolymer transport protein TolR